MIFTMIFHARLFYIEEFSKLPCPTCPPCQTYISVGLDVDTLLFVLPCPVSKIKRCIRYDGYVAYLGMVKTNMEDVRFCRLVNVLDSFNKRLFVVRMCYDGYQ